MKTKIIIAVLLSCFGAMEKSNAEILPNPSIGMTNCFPIWVTNIAICMTNSIPDDVPDDGTIWIGSPITGGDRFFPARGLLDQEQKGDVIIGLATNGLVIWQARNHPQKKEIIVDQTRTSSSQTELQFDSDIRLELVTNWTGYTFQGRELGYVATNHIADVFYQGATNSFTMKTTPSDTAVWRTNRILNAPMQVWITKWPPVQWSVQSVPCPYVTESTNDDR